MSENKTRRSFLKQSSAALAAAPLLGAISSTAHAGGSGVLKLALIGCGGRGRGAADDALTSTQAIKLVAMADAFDFQINDALSILKPKYGDRVDVSPGARFAGLDAYKKAIDAGVDGVILATQPGYRPMHFEYAVKEGKHVFMEKPVATDAPGVRRVLEANKIAKEKNLKVGVGLQRHHQASYLETYKRIQDGAIGDIVYFRCYWNGGPIWVRGRNEMAEAEKLGRQPTELEYQTWNWYNFIWQSGDHIVEQHIHNIDVCNWFKGAIPVSAQGMGGRQARGPATTGQIYDHFAVEFIYEDETRMISQCRQIPNTYSSVSEHAHGTKGYANIAGATIEANGEKWRHRGDKANPYVVEHEDLWRAVQDNTPFNEADFGAEATMTAILGRMAAYSGKLLRYQDAFEKGAAIVPTDEELLAGKTRLMPDAEGRYPVAMPGSYDPFVLG